MLEANYQLSGKHVRIDITADLAGLDALERDIRHLMEIINPPPDLRHRADCCMPTPSDRKAGA